MGQQPIDQTIVSSEFEFASLLVAVWQGGDEAFRHDLQEAIRSYVQRNPALRGHLDRAARLSQQVQQRAATVPLTYDDVMLMYQRLSFEE